MNKKISKFFGEAPGSEGGDGHYHKVVALHEAPQLEWSFLKEKAPLLPRGWFELCHLPAQTRVEFVRDFWAKSIPYIEGVEEFIDPFFDHVIDIGIFLSQKLYDSPFDAHMVYSMEDGESFFVGKPGASDEDIQRLAQDFPQLTFPEDFLAFLKIHDGFSKTLDTGLIPSDCMRASYVDLQSFMSKQDPLITGEGEWIDTPKLIPFYQSFGLHCYQCFYADWYPGPEMGNVYYSGIEHGLSNFRTAQALGENLAFVTFVDWLGFYIKEIEGL